MSRTRELVEGLQSNLCDLGYTRVDQGRIGDVVFEAVLTTNGRSSRKFACAVVRLPEEIHDVRQAAKFVGRIRRSLQKRYAGGFPWPKRLGTYTVLLGGRDLCERLRDREGLLVDTGGLHVNVMLGTVLVDTETLRTRSDNTWGLLDTGDQFRRIQDAVAAWCRCHRQPVRMRAVAGGVLSVA